MIWTKIIGVEGMDVDHQTTTEDPYVSFYYLQYLLTVRQLWFSSIIWQNYVRKNLSMLAERKARKKYIGGNCRSGFVSTFTSVEKMEMPLSFLCTGNKIVWGLFVLNMLPDVGMNLQSKARWTFETHFKWRKQARYETRAGRRGLTDTALGLGDRGRGFESRPVLFPHHLHSLSMPAGLWIMTMSKGGKKRVHIENPCSAIHADKTEK